MLKSIFQQFFHRQARRRRRRMTDGKAMDIFPDDIRFQVDDSARMLIHERRIGHGMGNDGNGKLAAADGYDSQADAVDGDRAFFDDERSMSLGMEMVMTRAIPSVAMRATWPMPSIWPLTI